MDRLEDNMDEMAAKVMAALKSFDAIGRDRAKPQSQIAAAAGLGTRQLRHVTLAMNVAGVPVVSTCTQPTGIFLAESIDELKDYAQQLHSRLVGNAGRLKAVNQMIRAEIAKAAVEPDGQGRLCFA